MSRILVADDEAGLREFCKDTLELEGHTVDVASDGISAIAALGKRVYEIVLTDLNMPNAGGMEVVRWISTNQPETQVIVLTAHGTVDTAVEAMKLGAIDFIQKPVSSPDALAQLVAKAQKTRNLQAHVDSIKRVRGSTPQLTYGAPAMKQPVDSLHKVAKTTATVLLLGESGVGKEVAARTVHEMSARSGGPFVALNCATLSNTLLESELFGHEKGAFTGASDRQRGRIELAAGGTFFLDEIGELRLDLQAKLLRVLQENTFQRIGGAQLLDADVRWIAATNRDLNDMVSAGTFREDLYHRIAVFPIALPPLRERSEDLAPITAALLSQICRQFGCELPILSAEAQSKLVSWRWPGNVRELRNALERAVILADGEGEIQAKHLVLDAGAVGSKSAARTTGPRTLAEAERETIETALDSVAGNRRLAAKILGIAERTLYDKIRKYEF